LRYFPERHHEELACDFVDELRRFGHIYMHRFAPRDAATGAYVMAAQPIDRYPAKSTQAAALMHMIQNNLDPTVAQFPAELVTYGGNGSAFSNWAQYHETMRLLAAMDDDQTLVLYSGHPMGLFPSHKDAPRLVVTNGMGVPNYSSREHYEEMFLTGVSSYGQMTAGSFCYIGPQGIVHGTVLTLLNAGRKYLGVESLRGKVFITAGLGGMSGAQPKAAVICGAVCICAEVSREAAEKRLAQGWVQEITGDLERCIEMASAASRERRGTSIAYVGNVVDLWERLAEKAAKKAAGGGAAAGDGFADSFVPDLGSDQTSCHIPFSGGYYPAGHSFEDGARMMAEDPAAFKEAVQESLRRQVAAVNKLSERGMAFWDYGNSFLLEASRAGSDIWEQSEDGDSATDVDAGRFRYPTYVQDIMGDIFSLGFGPFRWVCTSGQSQDLAKTDEIALQVLLEIRGRLSDASGGGSYAARAVPQLDDNILWIREAEDHKLVVGSQARILYANAEARSRIAQAFNEAVRDRRLEGPVMLSRDHHDVSGTDSPWRETSNVEDGSKFCADMAVQNVIGDACRGATSVSLHNGGGTGWGESINGGFLLCLDGSDDAARRARQMLHWDVFNGIARRAWAGNENALSYTAAEEEDNESFQVGYPNKVDSGVLQRAMAKAAAWLP
jgi:urocanate hydratase